MNEKIIEKINGCKGIYYFHTMKTGGTYMRHNLKRLCKKAGIDLICSSYTSGCLPSDRIPEGYITITSVRDPLEMLASYWEYMKYSSTPTGKKDGGFGHLGWMLGRRTPFENFSEFMNYFTTHADFQYMLQNKENAWSYTMESGSFIRSQTIGIDDIEKCLTLCTVFRPPPRYPFIKHEIGKWVTSNRSVFWKNPSLRGCIQDSYSYYWYMLDPSDINSICVSKLHILSESPWPAYQCIESNPDHPASHFILSNLNFGWCSWQTPIIFPDSINKVPTLSYVINSVFNTDNIWSALLDVWEYQLSPYHKLFKFDKSLKFECCFDIILKQENLTVGFDSLKKIFGVDFDSSKKMKVTLEKRDLQELLSNEEINDYNETFFKRERSLFGYDNSDRENDIILFGDEVDGFFDNTHPRKMKI